MYNRQFFGALRRFSTTPKIAEFKIAQLRRLKASQLLPEDKNFPGFKKRLESARVFYDADVFPPNKLKGNEPFTLERSITKVPAIDVEASKIGELPLGGEWPGQEFFMNLQSGDPRGLSPDERLHARKKIFVSDSMIYRVGGYPKNNPVVLLPTSVPATIFTLAGMQLEHEKLDYKNLIIDAYRQPAEHQKLLKLLKENDLETHGDYRLLTKGLFNYIKRDPKTGGFYTSPIFMGSKNALILNREAYFQALVKDFTLLFAAAEKTADPNKKNYFKLPFIGMGFFANVNGEYNIHHVLVPIYINALKEVLKSHQFKQLEYVEVPYFDHITEGLIEIFTKDDEAEINGVKLIFSEEIDLLQVKHVDLDQYRLCVVNPSDAHAYPGNEYGLSKYQPTSVESAIGNNTDIRYVQNFAVNEELLKLENWVGVKIAPHNYSFVENKDNRELVVVPCLSLAVLPPKNIENNLAVLTKKSAIGSCGLFAENNYQQNPQEDDLQYPLMKL
ncbi:MAG: hypothetical protein ACD_46C00085G0002 [uncultured bacterium]|nr:MAG: hypothetical protein ACD_46C00085G0002 [uncultured bacterium]